MKKIIIYALLLTLSTSSFCQQTIPPPSVAGKDFLLKSKMQKTAAWILLASGSILTSIGLVKLKNDWHFMTSANSGVMGDVVMISVGTGIIIGSAVLFSASKKNYKKGMNTSAFFKFERKPLILRNSIVQNYFPAISIKIGWK